MPAVRAPLPAPWPVAAAMVGGAFWLFPPLGVASLAYLVMRRRRERSDMPPWAGRGSRGFGRHGSTGNAAFDEARAEAWREMEAEAEAFDDYRHRERMARDRAVYDRFRTERATKPAEPPVSGEPPIGGPSV